jgi:hypothetical protein
MRRLRVFLLAILAMPGGVTAARAQSAITVTPTHCLYMVGDKTAWDRADWTRPEFDDSGWASSLPDPERTLPASPYVRTRCRLDLRPLASSGMVFVQVEEFSAWQAFVDGEQVGSFGNIESGRYWMDLVQRFPVPQPIADRGVVLVALRETRRGFPAVRYSPQVAPISAGSQKTLEDQTRLAVLQGFINRRVQFLCYGIVGVAGVLLLVLTGTDRSRRDVFWLELIILGTVELRSNELAQVLLVHYPHWLEMTLFWMGQWLYLPYIFFFYSLTGRKVPWIYIAVAIVTPVEIAPALLSFLVGPRLDQLLWYWDYYLSFSRTFIGLIGLVASSSAIVAFWPVWKVKPELRPFFWVSVLSASGEGVNAAVRLPWLSWVDPTSIIREYRAAVVVPVVVGMFFLLARRQRQVVEERGELQAEMRAAQEMQRLLVPEALDLAVGISMEVAYRPAKEVGGDFYFVRNTPAGQLVVIGDVSGKGLRAAMMASTLVGALRNEESSDPAEVLKRLNAVALSANSGGFVTCLCALFEAGRRLRFANAGQILPYLDGEEVPAENGLPLGLVANAAYQEASVQIEDRTVTLLSDGVLEAQSPQGELLGFERMAALTVKPAAEIADAAQQWGQEDDITVLTVRSVAVCA